MPPSWKPIAVILCLALGCGGAFAADTPPVSAMKERAAAGERLAREACATCHQVSRNQPKPPAVFDPDQKAGVSAPSFLAIARDPVRDADYLRARITHPHYPMREQAIDEPDIEALVAYIGSLRGPAGRRR